MGLPDSVKEMAEYSPVEDIVLPVLRARLSGVPVWSLIPERATFPFVIIRRAFSGMYWRGDGRGFMDHGYMKVDCYADGIDADADGALLSEAVRVALYAACREQAGVTVPQGTAFLHGIEMLNPPRRESDWATGSGAVQYADLPAGAYRYEATYRSYFRYQWP